ncbi:uncharacterized protein BT62DRAFT_1013861 [Guyanagaster necrorhizus]|uniref:Uncharacterized protein n=1 Tax=Guyanagaster necrorhizus TaxID=856835 RepID=A0A9P7VFK6_9AGAR|nr:uncharacterized protein BT62DRAFT_1013861 [Guyanagaster necrorhizus MCA 3950]KAG7439485.1 hypothetical protein BT62DRAFT_1013861 [Guyanagaster necrorhizus MCA 3950]
MLRAYWIDRSLLDYAQRSSTPSTLNSFQVFITPSPPQPTQTPVAHCAKPDLPQVNMLESHGDSNGDGKNSG